MEENNQGSIINIINHIGPVAQRLEHPAHNGEVDSSILSRPIRSISEIQEFGKIQETFQFSEHLLEQFASPRTKIHGIVDRRSKNYANYTTIEGIIYPSTKAGFYYDTVHYIIPIVSKSNKALACLGFEQVKGTKEIIVIQLQGSKNIKLKIKWDKLLLHTLCEWAFKMTPIEQVRILASYHIPYWPRSNDGTLQGPASNKELEERRKRFHLRYDVLPRRMGFRPSKEQGLRDKISAAIQVESLSPFYDYQAITSEMYFKKFPEHGLE